MDVISYATQWTAFSVAIVTILVGLARVYTKVKNANKDENTASEITNKLLVNLKNEISRLEEIIQKLNKRIEHLESNINDLRNLEILSATDFGALETVIETIPCVDCLDQGNGFAQLQEVIIRMKERRKKRHELINVN